MRVLVTGGSGFIGSHIVDKLVDAAHQVRILDIKEPYRNDIGFIQGSITSKKDISKAIRDIDVVYHIAAFSNINFVKDNPVDTIESNILGTLYLLEESRKNMIKRFILASSVYVNSEQGHLYTTSKLVSEMLCKNYNTLYSLPYTILRYGTAYGPRSREADVISIFVKEAAETKEIKVYGSGHQKRNFIFVSDMASGSVAAMEDVGRNKTYMIAGLESVSINELAVLIKEMFNGEISIKYYPSENREDDYQGEIGELEKTISELNWKPETSLKEGIKKYTKWLRMNNSVRVL